MISYEPFFRLLKERNMSPYTLVSRYGVSSSLIDRLRHDRPITTVTLNDLCRLLHCKVADILCYIDDEEQ